MLKYRSALLMCLLATSLTSCRRVPTGKIESGSCKTSIDCAGNPNGLTICDQDARQCVQCLGPADCPENNDCTEHRCVPSSSCTDSSQCAEGVCDTSAGRCVQCMQDTDCGDQKRCAGNTCHTACTSNDACTAQSQVCNVEAGYCVTCLAGQTSCVNNGVATCNANGDGFGTPEPCATTCEMSSTGARCVGESDGGTPDGGPSDAVPPDASGTCDQPATDFACNTIGKFPVPAGSQVLDGVGDEFAGVRAVTFSVNDAPFREGHANGDAPPTKSFPEKVTFRAAWSPEAFHLHLRVTDTSIKVNTSELWNGDAVDLMLASSDTFQFGGSETCSANALQLEVAPSTTPANIIYASGSGKGTVPTEWYATRITAEAYEIEFRIPWQAAATAPAAGGKIGFHLGVSIADEATERELWVTLPFESMDPATTTCSGMAKAQPWCEGRLWCKPTLSEQSCP